MRKRQKFSISSQFPPASLSSTCFSMRMDNRFLFCCPWTIYMTNGMRSEAIRCETDKRLADTRDDPPRLLLRNAVPSVIVDDNWYLHIELSPDMISQCRSHSAAPVISNQRWQIGPPSELRKEKNHRRPQNTFNYPLFSLRVQTCLQYLCSMQ